MKKSNKKIINGLFLTILIMGIILFIFDIKLGCLFKKYLHIPCPGCGLTRSFKAIFKLDFINAFKYNILGIPLFISILLFLITYIISFIFKKDYINKLFKFYTKYSLIIIIFILISWIYNIIKY